jgi:hypothetical protein
MDFCARVSEPTVTFDLDPSSVARMDPHQFIMLPAEGT